MPFGNSCAAKSFPNVHPKLILFEQRFLANDEA